MLKTALTNGHAHSNTFPMHGTKFGSYSFLLLYIKY